jgi:predicted phosphoadenosine phosphosulfate sulfurtransferase
VSEISPEDLFKVTAETEGFNFGRSVGTLTAEGYSQERILFKVAEWKKYRNTLTRDLAVVATDAYRMGYHSQVPK